MAPKTQKKDLHPTRERLINSIERIKMFIDKNELSLSIVELNTRLSLLETIFSQLYNIQSEIEQVECSGSVEFQKMQFIEDLYCGIKSKILTIIEKQKRRSSLYIDPNQTFSSFANNSSMTEIC